MLGASDEGAVKSLVDLLREPGADTCELDSGARIEWHRSVLERKRLVREVFLECQYLMREADRRFLQGVGVAIELGAGVSAMRDSFPDVWSSDVVYGRHLDLVLDAERLGVRDASVRVIFAQNAFHHFPQPERFFSELVRVLTPGGGAVLLEPYYGPMASFVYKRLFRGEAFDMAYRSWETPHGGPMCGANQAQSYVVFVRDRQRFETRFPALEIVHEAPMRNWLRYLVSGGLNFRQLLPDRAAAMLRAIERGLAPTARLLALHHLIVLKKVST
jgi:SAM-dependent methyltransferase